MTRRSPLLRGEETAYSEHGLALCGEGGFFLPRLSYFGVKKKNSTAFTICTVFQLLTLVHLSRSILVGGFILSSKLTFFKVGFSWQNQ